MINQAEKIYNNGKKSLETLLREKAYSDVQKTLKKNNIDINDVTDEDIENLVAAKTQDMMNGIKGFGIGTAFAIAISLLTGV
jgi:hypothetical protein